jgi:hypothetical protein
MHVRIDQLLSIRDGEPVEASVRAHVESCRECSDAVQRLRGIRVRLAALPDAESNPAAWQSVQRRLAARERPPRRRAPVARAVAAASIAALALIATLYRGGGDATRAAGPVAIPPPSTSTAVTSLLDRSLELEQALAAMPSRPAVERAETSIPIDALQARVQWIDHQLSLADAEGAPAVDAERLWRERVEVMSSLVRLRYVEAQRVTL